MAQRQAALATGHLSPQGDASHRQLSAKWAPRQLKPVAEVREEAAPTTAEDGTADASRTVALDRPKEMAVPRDVEAMQWPEDLAAPQMLAEERIPKPPHRALDVESVLDDQGKAVRAANLKLKLEAQRYVNDYHAKKAAAALQLERPETNSSSQLHSSTRPSPQVRQLDEDEGRLAARAAALRSKIDAQRYADEYRAKSAGERVETQSNPQGQRFQQRIARPYVVYPSGGGRPQGRESYLSRQQTFQGQGASPSASNRRKRGPPSRRGSGRPDSGRGGSKFGSNWDRRATTGEGEAEHERPKPTASSFESLLFDRPTHFSDLDTLFGLKVTGATSDAVSDVDALVEPSALPMQPEILEKQVVSSAGPTLPPLSQNTFELGAESVSISPADAIISSIGLPGKSSVGTPETQGSSVSTDLLVSADQVSPPLPQPIPRSLTDPMGGDLGTGVQTLHAKAQSSLPVSIDSGVSVEVAAPTVPTYPPDAASTSLPSLVDPTPTDQSHGAQALTLYPSASRQISGDYSRYIPPMLVASGPDASTTPPTLYAWHLLARRRDVKLRERGVALRLINRVIGDGASRIIGAGASTSATPAPQVTQPKDLNAGRD
jgi:hypothetical protein